ncbi:MAG: type I glyceraldehyde-3-phosphate dehydrogenase [Deltaproteobacteria bacterium]|nr:type I glyceraldehyde-3-phosphate dehydrogenase [Deltaproteobacteria bacterium]
MAIKYAINGFGRIGRNIVRAGIAKGDIELVAINDLTDAQTLAYLLKHDSIHGNFPGEVSVSGDNAIIVNGKTIKVLAEKDPSKYPWKELGADIIVESTGIFTKKEKALCHMQAGAKKVIISAPANDADFTLVYGVNHKGYKPAEHHVISNGSCTTNCLAPVAKVILEKFGIVKGMMTTVHSYTNDQRILDLPHKDPRRARAAALSMIPTSTGAAKAMSLVIPELAGKLDGLAVRVPTPNVSLVDFVCETETDVTVADVNKALIEAANGELKGVLAAIDEPLVSCDFNGSSTSSNVDLQQTMVVGKRMLKVLSWYDNEMGFSYRMNDVMSLMAKSL